MKGKKKWLTAIIAALVAGTTVAAPGVAPLVEVALGVIGALLVGDEQPPCVVQPDDPIGQCAS